jgi:hypothetical protein
VQGNYLTEQLVVGATATAAKMLPGALVIKNTNDYGVGESGSEGKVIGWLGYGATNANYKPTNRDTAYARGDYVAVHNGSNFRVRAIIDTEAADKGAPLTADTDGTVTAATADAPIVCHAAETVANTATTIWVVSNI